MPAQQKTIVSIGGIVAVLAIFTYAGDYHNHFAQADDLEALDKKLNAHIKNTVTEFKKTKSDVGILVAKMSKGLLQTQVMIIDMQLREETIKPESQRTQSQKILIDYLRSEKDQLIRNLTSIDLSTPFPHDGI